MIMLNIFLCGINEIFPILFEPEELSCNFAIKLIHYDYKSNKMGNQCCQEMGNYPGEIKKASFSKFQYTFQEDKQEMPSPITQASKQVTYVPPNQYNERQTCQQPKISPIVKQMMNSVVATSFNSPSIDHGAPDSRFYQFKRSGNIYRGQWKNNIPHGIGTLYFSKGSVFIGSFIEGVPFGKGRLIMNTGAYYEGEIRYGKANGEGEFRDGDYLYRGQFKDDMKHGEGMEKESNYNFIGTFQNGERLRGVYKYQNCIYKGQFENDEFHGQGELQNEDGSQYIGSFKNGKFHGYGEFKWPDSSLYRGYYCNGKRQGDGQFYNSKNSSISRGIWKSNVLNGQGEYKDYRGKVTKCIWENGKMTGIKTK